MRRCLRIFGGVEGEGDGLCGSATVAEGLREREGFAADVAEGELDGAGVEVDGGDAGELADGFVWRVVREESRAGDGGGAVEVEAAEDAVDLAAGADALDDLLAEVAAFAEVEGAGGSGFLGEVAVADVDAEEGCAFEDAEEVDCGGAGVDGAATEQFGGDGGERGLVGPDLKARDEGAVGVEDGEGVGLPEEVGEGGRGAGWGEDVGLKEVEVAEDLGRVGAGQEEALAIRCRGAEFDVVHDDEAVEERGERGDLRGGSFEQEAVGFGEDVGVALDAALGVEEEVVAAGAGGEVPDGVGDHAVEPADAVGAGDGDPGGAGEGGEAGGGEETFHVGLGGQRGRGVGGSF